jgi:hypothetical protein
MRNARRFWFKCERKGPVGRLFEDERVFLKSILNKLRVCLVQDKNLWRAVLIRVMGIQNL